MGIERYLVVNADDFGYTVGVNRGIIDAHESGIVTSASLMVRQPDAVDAARYARDERSLSVGIHIDLGEWIYKHGDWAPSYQRVVLEDPTAVENEVRQQIAVFRDLVGRDPTHFDSHQNVHLREPVRRIVTSYGRTLGVPVRYFTSGIHYCGAFYGQTGEGESLPENISSQALIELLRTLPQGIVEMGSHPGYGKDLSSVYSREREEEVTTLCDPAVRRLLESFHVKLVSFATLPATAVW